MRTSDLICVDTSAAIELLDPRIPQHRSIQKATMVFVPLPVLGELRFGVLNAPLEWRQLMSERLEGLLRGVTPLLPDLDTVEHYANVRKQIAFPSNMSRRRESHLLNDLWVAALCIQHELPLLTSDQDFERIEGLSVLRE
jgi:predicted nucleic acid-binding protein